MSDPAIDHARNIGIQFRKQDNGTYTIDLNSCAVNDLCPSFIHREKNGSFSEQAFLDFIAFLHQPLQVLADRLNPSADKKAYHKLKQLLSGTVITDNLTFADDEHEQVENSLTSYTAEKIKPDLKVIPQKGFEFHRLAIAEHNIGGPLSQWYAFHVPQQKKTLTTSDLEKIACAFFKTPQVESWLEDETRNIEIINHVREINNQAGALNITEEQKNQSPETAHVLQTLLSCVENLLHDKEWVNAGSHLHRSRPYAQALDLLKKETTIARAVLERLQQQPLSETHIQSFAVRFMPLLSIAQRFAFGTESPAQIIDGLVIPRTAKHLPAHYRIFDQLLTSIEQNYKPLITEIGSATLESLKHFFADMIHFITGSRTSFALFAALTASLFILNPGKAVETQNTIASSFNNAGGFTFNANGEVIPVKVNPLSNKNAQTWHWDVGLLGMYKHYTSDIFVSGPALASVDVVDTSLKSVGTILGQAPPETSIFSETANKVVSSIAGFLFGLNMLQNMSHAAFWLYMFNHGRKSGFRGASHILKLFSPLIDLGYRGAHSMGQLLSKASPLPFMKDLPNPDDVKLHLRHQMQEIKNRFKQPATTEEQSLTLADEIPLEVRARGLKRSFTLSTHHISPLIDILDRFEDTLNLAPEILGAEDIRLRTQLIERIRLLRDTLSNRSPKPRKELNLLFSEVAAAEIYHVGRSDILNTVAKKQISKKEFNALHALGELYAQHTESKDFKDYLHRSARISLYEFKRLTTVISNSLPHKAPIFYGLSGASGIAAFLEASGLSRQLPSQLHETINIASQGFGTLIGAIAPLPPFVAYNFFEDILAVHLAGGATLLTAGATVYYGLKLTKQKIPKGP